MEKCERLYSTFYYIQYEHHNLVYWNLLKTIESFSDYVFRGM